ncbi:oligosaccharide repeat unit polymerase [Vibrio fluvialis]|uniref:Oligosaccharide repeat unit polymerase n=1 Tax=Vibrio fluvialis TaxID=676 RepID=A0AAX2LR70_VIBFL|nr:oligosaccharide repeat unit polymerase [Vibrio fluvialis]AMF95569.1 oligosaccharide repeat unit polymerase [Vibrio fluvialis]EKO4010055.1 oligosaccharide repeat unit polymerase [Vibrio fluvialis]MBY8224419.1 oligosaccharide repeat unit polymerase [Vibrio fluvialis]MBY8228846.1 oligosaccharide repeat unit polymerase [Vibrio fluvialis]MCE7634944.1 oligosaccharide repeat unit polymerase [Vibrio fluvialis]
METIYTISTVIFLVVVLLSLYIYYSKSGNIFNPWFIISSLSILDVYIPAVIRLVNKELNVYASWMSHLDETDIIYGVIVYFIGWVFFSLGYFLSKKMKFGGEGKYERYISIKRTRNLLIFSLSFLLLYFYLTLSFFGGVSNYILISLSERFNNTVELPYYLSMLGQVKIMAMSIVFISSSLIFSSDLIKKRYPRLRFTLIFICLAVAFTTLFRGTILNFLLGFGALTAYIINKNNIGTGKRDLKNLSRKVVLIAVGLFIVVGASRTLYIARNVSEINNVSFSFVNEINKNLTGSSLLGVSSIVKYYGEDSDRLFMGKTITDMLLMPVPRSIYPSKPEWYGIDDITRKMGWPETTQSATSIQGELFANFSYPGLVLMILFGCIFGIFSKWSEKNIINASLYSFVVIPATLTTFWMSTTGLINALKFLPFIYLLLFAFSSKRLD